MKLRKCWLREQWNINPQSQLQIKNGSHCWEEVGMWIVTAPGEGFWYHLLEQTVTPTQEPTCCVPHGGQQCLVRKHTRADPRPLQCTRPTRGANQSGYVVACSHRGLSLQLSWPPLDWCWLTWNTFLNGKNKDEVRLYNVIQSFQQWYTCNCIHTHAHVCLHVIHWNEGTVCRTHPRLMVAVWHGGGEAGGGRKEAKNWLF